MILIVPYVLSFYVDDFMDNRDIVQLLLPTQ